MKLTHLRAPLLLATAAFGQGPLAPSGAPAPTMKAQVNTRHYLVFEMSAVQGASIGEIARTLGMNAAQVYIARHRVGRLVKAELKNIEGKI